MKRGTDCVQCGQFRVYQKLASGLCPECRGLNNKMKLVIFGDDNRGEVMDLIQYEFFLRNSNETDFNTHIAIDVSLDAESLSCLRQVTSGSAALAIVQGGLR